MFLGNGVYAFMQWIQLSLIVKFCPTQELGFYTLALAIASPLFLFMGFQLRSLIVTDSKREWTFTSYFVLRLSSMLMALFIIIGYALISKNNFQILFLVAVLKSIEGLAEIFNSQQQLNEQMKNVSRSLVLKGVSATVSIFIGVFLFNSLIFGLYFAIFSNILVLIFNDYINCKKLMVNEPLIILQNLKIKSLLIKSLPLGVVICIVSLNTNVSKYLVQNYLGTDMQGIYSTIAYCLVLGNFVNSAIGQSFSPRMSKYYADKNKKAFVKLFSNYLLVNIILGLLLYILSLLGGYYFLKVMFSELIASYSDLFSLIMFSGIFLYAASALGYTLTSMRLFKIQPFINGIVLLINILCCYFFLNKYGIYGAVYSSIIGFSVQSLITFYFIRKHL